MSREEEHLDRDALGDLQLQKLREMLLPVLQNNDFYRKKLNNAGITSPEEFQKGSDYRHLPFTTKAELSEDQAEYSPYGSNLTFPLHQYIRVHQTSGTTGNPLRWLDTEESWQWFGKCWATIFAAAGVTYKDRVFFAFSFGPFIGFWSAHEGARRLGALSISGGGMSSEQRIRAIQDSEATVLVCTPTYALYLAELARKQGLDIANSSVRISIHAGEPGASLPAIKNRIESSWGTQSFDHPGATEVGSWGFECESHSGVHLNESEFIWEVIDPDTGDSAKEGELVVTNLGRIGMPVIRYRTGDWVKMQEGICSCGRSWRRLDGGVMGRVDDALIVRGVNVYPSAIENIIRRFPEVIEFAVDVYRRETLDELEIRIESERDTPVHVPGSVAKEVQRVLGLRAKVSVVEANTLPRFELKAKRFKDNRK